MPYNCHWPAHWTSSCPSSIAWTQHSQRGPFQSALFLQCFATWPGHWAPRIVDGRSSKWERVRRFVSWGLCSCWRCFCWFRRSARWLTWTRCCWCLAVLWFGFTVGRWLRCSVRKPCSCRRGSPGKSHTWASHPDSPDPGHRHPVSRTFLWSYCHSWISSDDILSSSPSYPSSFPWQHATALPASP